MFLATTIAAMMAAFIPWLLPRSRWRLAVALGGTLFATAIFVVYEWYLRAITPPPGPTIRVDLVLLFPLLIIDWLSVLVACAQAADKAAESDELER